MKKLLAVIFSLAVLAGCSANESTEISEATATETSSAVTSESTAVTTAASAATTAATITTTTTTTAASTVIISFTEEEEKPPINAELGVNGDGTLSEVFTDRLAELAAPDEPVNCIIYPALWDFDEDGIPEIILTYHNSGQGLMPCYVYNAESLEQIGEFEGFCRDGFTRFINNDECTVIYNFYEHSVSKRVETVENVRIVGGKLVGEPREERVWLTAWDENYPAHIEFSEEYSNAENRGYVNTTAEFYRGDVCTSYNNENYEVDSSEFAVESYNNYVRAQALAKEETDKVILAGKKNQYVFLQNKEGFYFIDENGERTMLKEGWAYYDLYKLGGDIIVSANPGNLEVCDIYILKNGKPELVSWLSGKGMRFDYSHFYIGRFELTNSTYDGMVMDDGGGGMHTFKKYQFYRDLDGFHEYGSIVVPMKEFTEVHGEYIKPLEDELAAEDTKIHEVLYRGDGCFILNCRKTIFLDEEKTQPTGAYYTSNITLKPLYDGGFSELCRDTGIYRTALIPEIAVYPKEMYVPENDE